MSDFINLNREALSRRDVLKGLAAATAGNLLLQGSASVAAQNDEPLWREVRAAFSASRDMTNLNNAGVCPQPTVVQDAMIRAYRFANELPDVNMWEVLDASRDRIKEKLARIADCKREEIALNRNATEGLCTAVFGIDLAVGDEVILCDWDYESMRHAWAQRARRDRVVIKQITFDLMASDEEIIERYRLAITPRTKVMHLTHMVHYTGRVLPLAPLCALARKHNIRTIVDAAQSFAQVPLSFRQIDCDYFAASLHKWLCAPFGTGILIVKESRIDALWPLLAPYEESPKGIEKVDGWNLGTYSSPAEHAIETAVDFHDRMGTQRMHARLRALSRYWIERASDIPGFRLHTPLSDPQTAAVTLFSIDGIDAQQIEKRLLNEHAIRVRFRTRQDLSGVRVSPHVYTNEADLDRFVTALRQVVRAA